MKDWRKQGKDTVLGKVSGNPGKIQAGPDEIVIVTKDGEISDVFTEERKSVNSPLSSIGLGSKSEIYKATKSRFNISFWLGDSSNKSSDDTNTNFDLPILSKDKKIVPALLTVWIEVNDELPENLLNLLHGRQSISKYDIAEEIKDSLHSNVLTPELSQHIFEDLRGNKDLLKSIGNSVENELSNTLSIYGLRIQDFSISWGLTPEEESKLNQKKHKIEAKEIRNQNKIQKLRNKSQSNSSVSMIKVLKLLVSPLRFMWWMLRNHFVLTLDILVWVLIQYALFWIISRITSQFFKDFTLLGFVIILVIGSVIALFPIIFINKTFKKK